MIEYFWVDDSVFIDKLFCKVLNKQNFQEFLKEPSTSDIALQKQDWSNVSNFLKDHSTLFKWKIWKISEDLNKAFITRF